MSDEAPVREYVVDLMGLWDEYFQRLRHAVVGIRPATEQDQTRRSAIVVPRHWLQRPTGEIPAGLEFLGDLDDPEDDCSSDGSGYSPCLLIRHLPPHGEAVEVRGFALPEFAEEFVEKLGEDEEEWSWLDCKDITDDFLYYVRQNAENAE